MLHVALTRGEVSLSGACCTSVVWGVRIGCRLHPPAAWGGMGWGGGRDDPFTPSPCIEDPDNAFIQFAYEGDVARVYADGELIEDNFYNGKPMLIRASQLIGKRVIIRILPISKDYPIYFQPEQRVRLESQEVLLQAFVPKVIIRNMYTMTLPVL